MKLLICTQAMDKNHPILGFFHRWVEEFAKHCEVVHVICLIEGEHSLPANVHVHSLGKERGKNRLRELWRFYRLMWQLRHEHDSVFVHMNQIYVILGAILWRLWGKRISLWYMHGTVSTSLRLAEKMTHVIFTGSKESFPLQSRKLIITGHGIDIDLFTPMQATKDIDLVTVGRITPSKNIELLLEALAEVRKTHSVTLTIVGRASSEAEAQHQSKLQAKAASLGVVDAVIWHGGASNTDLPSLLNRSKVFVHAATNGSLDKAVLEAMAVGLPVVSSALGVRSILTIRCTAATGAAMAASIKHYFESPVATEVSELHTYVTENHSILSLIPKILTSLKPEL
jgi:glycosyltransferase involved in cell wall biosynthesis